MLKPSAPQDTQRYSLVIVARVTSRCPMTCQYCGFSRQLKRDRRDIDLEQLQRFGQALHAYQVSSGRDMLVCWLGGEPYLWPGLWSTTQLYREHYCLPIGVTTSGINLDQREIQQNTLRWIDELTISVDGLAAHHDWARQTPGGWDKLKHSVCQLDRMRADSGPLLRANMVIMQRNIDQFAVICQELATWGFDEISFNQLGGLDRPEFYPENRIEVDQWHRFRQRLPDVRAMLADQGVTLAGSESYLDRLEATTCDRKLPLDECYPGEEFWFIDELGRLSPCSYTGNIYSLSIDELQAADLPLVPERLRQLRRQATAPACADCHATHQFAKFGTAPDKKIR